MVYKPDDSNAMKNSDLLLQQLCAAVLFGVAKGYQRESYQVESKLQTSSSGKR